MLRKGSRFVLANVVLIAAVLVCPYGAFAQRGAGGGHTGGGVATGGGLASVGRSTGVDEKDDLRDYHEALAVQASSEQIAAYTTMLKSTYAASASLQGLQEQLGKPNGATEFTQGAAIEKAVEEARSENKKFLDSFSDPQKAGLKEISKRLIKDDSDLAQAARSFGAEVGNVKGSAQAITPAAQTLEHALATLRQHQVDLGQEMSIGSTSASDSAFNLTPLKTSVKFANQAIAITTSGVVSRGQPEGGQSVFAMELTEDLSDLQQNATEVLRAQLDQYDRCGERIEIHNATLAPQSAASLVVLQLHYERWSCLHGDTNEMAEGNGTVEVKLTPAVASDGTVRLAGEMGRVDVPGMVGEFLRSGFLGDSLRDKVTQALLSTIDQGADFKSLLPPSSQGFTTLHRARFEGTGMGRLNVVLEGEIRLSEEKATVFTGELKRASAQAASGQPASGAEPALSR